MLTSRTVTVASDTPVDEIQSVTVDATAGTWTLTILEDTTGPLDFDVDAADIQTAIELFDWIVDDDIVVTGGPGDDGGNDPYIFTFGGTLAGQPAPAISVNDDDLTGTAVAAVDTAGARRQYRLNVADTDTRAGKTIAVANTGAQTAYLGGPTVTAATGFPLASGAQLPWAIDLDSSESLWAVTTDGQTTTLQCVETGK